MSRVSLAVFIIAVVILVIWFRYSKHESQNEPPEHHVLLAIEAPPEHTDDIAKALGIDAIPHYDNVGGNGWLVCPIAGPCFTMQNIPTGSPP